MNNILRSFQLTSSSQPGRAPRSRRRSLRGLRWWQLRRVEACGTCSPEIRECRVSRNRNNKYEFVFKVVEFEGNPVTNMLPVGAVLAGAFGAFPGIAAVPIVVAPLPKVRAPRKRRTPATPARKPASRKGVSAKGLPVFQSLTSGG